MCAATPLVGVLEQVPDFYLQDDQHRIFSEMCTMMEEAVVTLPAVYVFDTRLGGWIHRERGITFFEVPMVRVVLPSWVVPVPSSDTLRPQEMSWMDPVGQVSLGAGAVPARDLLPNTSVPFS